MRGIRLVLLLAIGVFVAASSARTRSVPKDYSTIQKAVDEAGDGDTVFVAAGVYAESIVLRDNLALVGEDREKAIIWGKMNRPTVRGADYVLVRNLTIKGGRVGILCDNKLMTIERNIICDNVETGVHCLVSMPIVRNNVICRNKWTGVYCESVRSIRNSIEHNIIAENGYSGVVLAGNSEVIIEHNILFENQQFGVWVGDRSRRSRVVFNDIYGNRVSHNVNAQVNNNVVVDPGFVPLVPRSYNYLKLLGPSPLEGAGRDGETIGPVSESEMQHTNADTDHDGVPDSVDKCINVPEDADGFEDGDGCPDFDNDGDGIYDGVDQCPTQAEDPDRFADQDGCPDPDNDADGIPDGKDACPLQPETVNAYLDDDGCPDQPPGSAAQPTGAKPVEAKTKGKNR